MNGQNVGTTILTRRTFLAATLAAGTAAMAAYGKPISASTATDPITVAEATRPHTGRTVTAALTPGPADIDLGGPVARTLAYNNSVPGPLIRANVGNELAINVTNGLDHPSSVHWHGIALRNDMDGAMPATPNIDPSSNFTYRFSAPHPGTYWAHPHTGLDADYGLYVPVNIDDPPFGLPAGTFEALPRGCPDL
jgi:FtsP/CotA-like multicopper oxidase with cupredoxin domain